MNEQQKVEEAVRLVLAGMQEEAEGNKKPHVCKCKKNLNLQMANDLIETVKEEAARLGINVVVAVADSSARLISVQCMDDAYIASLDIAINKTYTSASLKMSTEELGRQCGPDGPLYGIQNTNNGKIVIFGGGQPLLINGRVAGALGVSGGTAKEDTYLADYGKRKFEEVAACR